MNGSMNGTKRLRTVASIFAALGVVTAVFACTTKVDQPPTQTIGSSDPAQGGGSDPASGSSSGSTDDGGAIANSQADATADAANCSSGNCLGCCTTTGLCEPGNALTACGVSAELCFVCPQGSVTCTGGGCQ